MINALRNIVSGYRIRERLGSELVVGFDTTAWWSVLTAGWSVTEGVSVDCDGTDDISASKASLWSTTKTYRIRITAAVNSGDVTGPFDGTNVPSYGAITTSGSYTGVYSPATTTMNLYSNSFDGSVTSLSIKEIL